MLDLLDVTDYIRDDTDGLSVANYIRGKIDQIKEDKMSKKYVDAHPHGGDLWPEKKLSDSDIQNLVGYGVK